MVDLVDAHQHFWHGDSLGEQSWRSSRHDTIARAYLPDDLSGELAASGVGATVLVQASDNASENDRLARFAADTDYVAAVIGWLPVGDPSTAAAELDRIADMPKLRGVRCQVGRDPLAWLADDAVVSTFAMLAERGLCWEVIPVTAEQVDAVCALARRVPELSVVVDHLARPPLESRGWQPWADLVSRLAEQPNVVIKLSVGVDVLTDWPWQADALTPYVDHTVTVFGPERTMLASNWPVVLLRRDYGRTLTDLDAAARAVLDDDQMRQVRAETATRTYRL